MKIRVHRILLPAMLITMILSGCSKSSLKIVGSWVNKEKAGQGGYKSVFIAALTPNLETRTILENELAAAAVANGIKAVKSLEVFGPVVANGDSLVIKALVKKVKESGCAAIMTVAMVDAKSETKYHPASSTSYYPYSYGYPGYYGNFANYYGYGFTIGNSYSPGYYTTDQTFFIETNLYDVQSQDILFSIQTKAVNPEDVKKSSQEFTVKLIDELKNNGLLQH